MRYISIYFPYIIRLQRGRFVGRWGYKYTKAWQVYCHNYARPPRYIP